jgi:tRNA-dihydrouridine synthase 1
MMISKADGVMSAEGNLSDPSIFSEPPPIGSEGREYWRGGNGKGGYRMDAIFRRYLDIIYKYVLDTPIPQRKSLFTLSDWVSEHSKGKAEDGEEEMKEVDDPDAEGSPKKKQKHGKGKITNNPNLTAMQGHLFRLLRPLVSKHTNIRDELCQSTSRRYPNV